jgi:hypothetical protein
MSRKRYPPEQIIGKLWEAEVALAQGETAAREPPDHLDNRVAYQWYAKPSTTFWLAKSRCAMPRPTMPLGR